MIISEENWQEGFMLLMGCSSTSVSSTRDRGVFPEHPGAHPVCLFCTHLHAKDHSPGSPPALMLSFALRAVCGYRGRVRLRLPRVQVGAISPPANAGTSLVRFFKHRPYVLLVLRAG